MTTPHVLLILAAAAKLLWQLRAMHLGLASRHWKHTHGKVLKCYVGEFNFSFSLGEGDGPDEGDNHTANILYIYTVGAQEFTSKRLTYRPTSGLLYSGATDYLQGIMSGREIDVYYDPRNPSRSVIIPGTSDDNAIRTVFAVVILAAAVWYAV